MHLSGKRNKLRCITKKKDSHTLGLYKKIQENWLKLTMGYSVPIYILLLKENLIAGLDEDGTFTITVIHLRFYATQEAE